LPGTLLRIAPPNDPGLAVTENHELIVNSALLDLINFFLLEQTDEDRADQLKIYLKSKLPSPASNEAVQIVDRYQAYMKAHDDLLAAQNLGHGTHTSAVDIDRIVTWRQQRDRLRRSILGDQVVQIWYQNDDAQLNQVLEEWRQRAEDEKAPSSPMQGPRYPVPHFHNKSDEERHRQYLLGVLEKAVTSFGTLSREGRQWAARYASYLDGANKIRHDVADISQRNLQLQELRLRSFPTEAERQRARDLGP
jgi:hypothetical protein